MYVISMLRQWRDIHKTIKAWVIYCPVLSPPSVFPETYWDSSVHYRCLLCIKGPVVLSSKAWMVAWGMTTPPLSTNTDKVANDQMHGERKSPRFSWHHTISIPENNFSPNIYLLICKTASLSVVHNINSHRWSMSRRAELKLLSFCPDKREKLV